MEGMKRKAETPRREGINVDVWASGKCKVKTG